MDHQLLQLVARIKIRLRQEKGIVLNTQRFFAERDYAVQMLDAAEDCEDVELVTSALALREHLGWLKAPAALATPQTPPAALHTAPESSAKPARYMFGARS